MAVDVLEIVIATANPHKVEELRSIFAAVKGDQIRLSGLNDLPAHIVLQEPAETGSTFEENASIKALSYAQQTGRHCLADDSGLEVDALKGAPGVISSHYCTDGREVGMPRTDRDRANNERVLLELAAVPAGDRAARFVCVMALAAPENLLLTSKGTFEGRIGSPPEVPRGANGFGYDPLFLVAPEYKQTSAELSPDRKNALSHRGQAARRLITAIRQSGILTRA